MTEKRASRNGSSSALSRLRGRAAHHPEGAAHEAHPPDGETHDAADMAGRDEVMERRRGPREASIVPGGTVAGAALVAVVAIMTFLAGLTIGGVAAVRTVASEWTSDIARETTIQIKPGDGLDVAAALEKARGVAQATSGVASARVMGERETAALLEPWLGTGLDLSNLPVPRLIIVELSPDAGPQTIDDLRAGLASQVPSASFDDHRQWTQRLSSTARLVVAGGLAILALVTAATVLCVVFATRAAVDAGRAIVEVLHFVGARDSFIAAEFQRHFLNVGLLGGAIGGVGAMAMFFLASTAPRWLGRGTPADTLIGAMSLDLRGYGGILGVAVLVSLVTAVTSRVTVYRTLRRIS
ncbi:ABC transporter permease [Ancylobacter sp. A5.8]|uniref:cell division protein FtsX n=1 Tax=Ancylobacter gelatini TaxID=2919920 RepID=UPI001F4F01DD|nr:ABC transporter permease [Ancylobacter gelatini]MCJ8144554.1 ABC transporter permease [Ancylobacter gelatini]